MTKNTVYIRKRNFWLIIICLIYINVRWVQGDQTFALFYAFIICVPCQKNNLNNNLYCHVI